MWWGAKLQSAPQIAESCEESGRGKTFVIPLMDIERLENDLDLLQHMDGSTESKGRHNIFRRSLVGENVEPFAALPWLSDDPLEKLRSVEPVARERIPDYWSADKAFWSKWRDDETQARESALEKVKGKLAESQREAASAAAAAEQARLDKERKAAEAKKKVEQEAATKAAIPEATEPTSAQQPERTAASSDVMSEYDRILEGAKQYRSEFIQVWRDISLAVSTTAANARSIQQNATKLMYALSRAQNQAGPSRSQVVIWLSTFCGAKIVCQACSGNKTLVWAFAYLTRIICEKFPEVLTNGVIGELVKNGGLALSGTPGIPMAKSCDALAKDCEIHARIWVAMMCVFSDEQSLWAWAAHAVNELKNRTSFVEYADAMWNLMKVFILMDMGMYDFRRHFGGQAGILINTLEQSVFPRIDAELQGIQQSTATSVQFRYYLDACYNIAQSRKFNSPPDGQVLSAAKESELSPEL